MVLGSASAVILSPILGASGAIYFFLASVLIDVDHYLDFLYRTRFKYITIREMFIFHKHMVSFWRRPDFLNIEIFHTIDFMVPLYCISLYYNLDPLKAVCYGIFFHMGCDMVYMMSHRIFFKRTYSLTEYLIRKRRLAMRGLNPQDVYDDAAALMSKEARPERAARGA